VAKPEPQIIYLDDAFAPCAREGATYARVLRRDEDGIVISFELVLMPKTEKKPETFASRFIIETHGDFEGHPFRGNQWTKGEGGGGEAKADEPGGWSEANVSTTSRHVAIADSYKGVDEPVRHEDERPHELLQSAFVKLYGDLTTPSNAEIDTRLKDMAQSAVAGLRSGKFETLDGAEKLTVEEWGAILDQAVLAGNESLLDSAVHSTAKL